jgi:hypothetical protein
MKKVFWGECLFGGDGNQGQVLMNAIQTYTEKVLVASEVSERGRVGQKAATRIDVEIFFGPPNFRRPKKLEQKAWQPLLLIHQLEWLGAQIRRVRMRAIKRMGMS